MIARPPALALLALCMLTYPVGAGTYESWPVLPPDFPSTGGGDIMIRNYRPIVIGGICATPFTATEPNGTIHRNVVEFEAVPVAGGVLCRNGRWRAENGQASGTTPLQVFIKNGIVRGTVPPDAK
ncbi:MAG TPA: hypothetical protein VEA41_16520 [Salinarimonas sp.]|nr:hypothetical protein [Salinarimonas sp.]